MINHLEMMGQGGEISRILDVKGEKNLLKELHLVD